MKYTCVKCNYNTDDRRLWFSHTKTKKHIGNVMSIKSRPPNNPRLTQKDPQNYDISDDDLLDDSKFKCEYCGIYLSKRCHLLRHYKTCTAKQHKLDLQALKAENDQIKNDSLIRSLEEKIKSVENENKIKIEMLEKQNAMLGKENEYHKSLIVSAGAIIKNSLSTLDHLILNYANAPPLQPLKDYSILGEGSQFINNLINSYTNGRLCDYIGDFLVKQYKTQDPSSQSNWNSDTSRLTYINRQIVDNKLSWMIDKKGVQMTHLIIDPVMDYTVNAIVDEMKQLTKQLKNEDDQDEQIQLMRKISILSDINKEIKTRNIHKNINKYLAPHLYFDKKTIAFEESFS